MTSKRYAQPRWKGVYRRHPKSAPRNSSGIYRGVATLCVAVGLWGCSSEASGPPAEEPPLNTGAPAESAQAAPSAATTTCAGVEARTDPSSGEAVPCASDEVCLDNACTPSPFPPETRAHAVGTSGLVNAWTVFDALPKKMATDAIAAEEAGKATDVVAPQGLCGGGPRLRVLKGKEGRFALAQGQLFTAEARTVKALVGNAGPLGIWLNGRMVTTFGDVQGRGRATPLLDRAFVDLELEAGINRIMLVAERPERGNAEFSFRLRDVDFGRAPDLLWAEREAHVACPPGALVDATLRWELIGGGFRAEGQPRYLGLLPRRAAAEPARLTAWYDGASFDGLPLAEGNDDSGAPTWAWEIPASREGKIEIGFNAGEHEASTHALTYLGDLHERAVLLREALGVVDRVAPASVRHTLRYQVQRIERSILDGERFQGWLKARIQETETAMQLAVRGDDPFVETRGLLTKAYRSPFDGSLEPYLLYVPPSYDPTDEPMALVAIAHGLGHEMEHAMRTLVGEAPDEDMSLEWAEKNMPAMGDLKAILVAPHGYGNAGPEALGEADVLAAIEAVRADYRVDPRRISLTGYSLGGTVAFVTPLHFPDVFSAAAPLCGYPNLTTYNSIRDVEKTPWEELLIEERYIVSYAENGKHIPLRIVHGGKDGPGRSKVVADRYRQLGYERIFDVQDDLDHNVWDYAYENGKMVGWLRGQERPERPAHVVLRTGHYRYHRSYWVELVAREASGFAQIDAKISPAQEITVKTDNVRALVLHLDELVPPGQPLKGLTIDDQTLALEQAKRLVLVRGADGWKTEEEASSHYRGKRPTQSGPIEDAYLRPLRFVVGTQTAAARDLYPAVAEHWSTYGVHDEMEYPIVTDEQALREGLAGTSLVLIGGPEENAATQKLAGSLPLTVRRDGITIGAHEAKGTDLGVSMIYPHPESPDQYIVVHAGTSPGGVLASRHLPRFLPDFIAYEAADINEQLGERLLENRKAKLGGFFDEDWGTNASP